MIGQIYTTILYQPLFNILIWFYNIVPGHDIGLAIILLTIFVKLVLYPFFTKSIKSQKALANIQPKIDEINKKFKDQKEKLASELMKLYKEEKVNPFSSCLPLLIQLPFLIAVYQVFRQGLSSGSMNLIYPFIHNPGIINTISFGFMDMSKSNLILAILAGISQYFQSRMMINKKTLQQSTNSMAASMNKQMLYFMPLITIFIGASLPAGLTLYWLFTTVLSILQQYLVFKKTESSAIVIK